MALLTFPGMLWVRVLGSGIGVASNIHFPCGIQTSWCQSPQVVCWFLSVDVFSVGVLGGLSGVNWGRLLRLLFLFVPTWCTRKVWHKVFLLWFVSDLDLVG